MIKKVRVVWLSLLLAVSFNSAWSQSSAWINFDQSYYKISTAQEQIHRLTYEHLSSNGFPDGINVQNLQLYFRGQEQAISIVDNGDGLWNSGDYIEFLGARNRGEVEEELYVAPEAQPHQYYSLYSDTTAFFLTWSTAIGKRMVLNDSPLPATPPRDFHWDQQLALRTSSFSPGRRYPVGGLGATYLSQYDYGEGWTGDRIRQGNFEDVVFLVEMPQTSAPVPQLELIVAGRNEGLHNVEVLVGAASALRSLGTFQFQNFDNHLWLEDLSWSDIPADGNLTVRVQVTSASTDQVSISSLRMSIPQAIDMMGGTSKILEFTPNGEAESVVNITNVSTPVTVYDITDRNNVTIQESQTLGTDASFVLNNANSPRRVLITDGITTILNPPVLKSRFRVIDPSQHDYLILSHQSLMAPGGTYQDPVQAYAAYRASEEGGSFDTLLVDIDLLYDQYNYGEKSPLAITKFLAAMLPGDPQYFLILGKGYNVHFNPYRQDFATATTFDLVPTAGFPGSDIALSSGLGADPYNPALPTGRVNARTPEAVAAYLDKIKEMESTAYNALWRKNIIHLSGGLTQGELNLFKIYVDQFKGVAEGPFVGSQVTTVNKQTNETTVLIDVAEEVNKGVSLITFFGHSSTSTTDIEIGNVTNPTLGYDNQGRYPMILVNGCNAGNIFFTSLGFGEDWVLAPNKGAVGFLAHTDAGFASNLKRYSDFYYEIAYGDSAFINKPIGDILVELGRRYQNSVTIDEIHIAQIQQEVFQGDPAFSFFNVDQPDFQTEDDLVSLETFDGDAINAQVDSFKVVFTVRNFGRTTEDSLNVTVRRTFGDGQVLTYDSVFYAPVSYQDTLSFTIRTNNVSNFGNNQFEVLLDFNQSVDELDETNNIGRLQFFIPQGGTLNVKPFNYAIVDTLRQTLIAQSSDPLSGGRTFLMEIDTLNTFNSPWKQSTSIASNGLAAWSVDLLADAPPRDSVVYYWRSKFEQPLTGEDTAWTVSSFINITGSPEGWSQARFPQFDENGTDEGITRDQGTWAFTSTENLVEITTYGASHPLNDAGNISVQIDGQPFIISTRLCPINSLNAIAFDKASTIPYAALTTGGFDVLDRNRCGRTPQVINTYTNNDLTNTQVLEEYIAAVGDGDYVILFSIGQANYPLYHPDNINSLSDIGLDPAQFALLQTGEPIIVVGKKGDPLGSAQLIRADESSTTPILEQEISLSETLIGRFDQGTITSPKIGPANSWGNFYLQFPAEAGELAVVDILGIDVNGLEQLLFENVNVDQLDISSISALQFPFLRLRARLIDQNNLTPAQLVRWQVIFESVPEGALLFRGNADNQTKNINVAEGQLYATDFTFYNFSEKSFTDSLTVQATLFNRSSRTSQLDQFKIAAISAGDSVTFNVQTETLGQVGINDFRVFVNPNILPEQLYNNNVNDFQEYLIVTGDDTHPILDVTFDGIYILDGDIVAPSPMISILLKDDNPLNPKQDTVGMEVFLKSADPNCTNCQFERINFSDPQVQWFAATEDDDFRVEFQPDALADGIYTLRVQGADNSGRTSGTEPYTINFEVINESTITNFYPYPNPFSTSTRFVFTLTGAEIPSALKIQILTVSGRVVREITQDELGPIRIGNNISEYAWDGRDEYGDQLANGVYLYRVLIDRPGDNFSHRQTSADKAFKKGYGKLYLLR